MTAWIPRGHMSCCPVSSTLKRYVTMYKRAARRAGSVDELEREVFRMAAGGEEGCRLVRDQRFIVGSWIEAPFLA